MDTEAKEVCHCPTAHVISAEGDEADWMDGHPTVGQNLEAQLLRLLMTGRPSEGLSDALSSKMTERVDLSLSPSQQPELIWKVTESNQMAKCSNIVPGPVANHAEQERDSRIGATDSLARRAPRVVHAVRSIARIYVPPLYFARAKLIGSGWPALGQT
jgi:hypothetical protein